MADPKKPSGKSKDMSPKRPRARKSAKDAKSADRSIQTPQLTAEELEVLRQRLQRKYR